MSPLYFLIPLLALAVGTTPTSLAGQYRPRAIGTVGGSTLSQIENGIRAQHRAGHPEYDPEFVFVVDPSKQRMHILSRRKADIVATLRCGTGKRGLGSGASQTPTGFFTIGGVRIAKGADTSVQTGDSKKGVSGVYAEMLYPPSHPDSALRGCVPNNVIIHSYNPAASNMLRERKDKRLIGRVPCTTGCPVVDTDQARELVPFLQASAGKFDPGARPNKALQDLIARGKVKQYSRDALGGAVFIMSTE